MPPPCAHTSTRVLHRDFTALSRRDAPLLTLKATRHSTGERPNTYTLIAFFYMYPHMGFNMRLYLLVFSIFIFFVKREIFLCLLQLCHQQHIKEDHKIWLDA
jgi:hypothetical protein